MRIAIPLVTIFLIVVGVANARTTIYVSPQGSDAATGTEDAPLASLDGARDHLRELRAAERVDGHVEIILRGGTYALAETFELGPQDSGTPQSTVTYRAAEDERVVISGGRPIADWSEAPDGSWRAAVDGDWAFRQLFVRGEGEDWWQRRYRPHLGPFVIAGLTDSPAREGQPHRQSQIDFVYHPGDLARWSNLGDVEVVALHDWSASRLRIAEIDEDRSVVTFTERPVYRIGHWWEDGRNPYYVENVGEALDQPGQWYHDRAEGTLTYLPLPGEELGSMELVAPRLETLVRVAGDMADERFVEHVEFEGLHFAHSAWQLGPEGYSSGQGMVDLPAAIEVEGAREVAIEGCVLAHLGAYAIRLGEGTHHCRVEESVMADLGGGGVLIGTTNRRAEEPVLPTHNGVRNCVISDGGLVHFSAHGVWVGIARNVRVRSTVIRRFSYSGASLGWSWNDEPTSCEGLVIEFCHIHDCMRLLADGGGIYTLGRQPRTRISDNRIHHIRRSSFAGRAPNNGIFFDQGSSGYAVLRNVIHDTAGEPVRFNQTSEEALTWEGNFFDVLPTEEEAAEDIAESAGLEPLYAALLPLADGIPAVDPPVLGWEMP